MWRKLNLSEVKLETLRENGYNAEVLDAVKGKKFETLKGNEVLKDVNAARFLLYALINSKETELYPLYASIENDVKQDLLEATYISNNILQTKPELIKDTPLANDEITILNNITGKPEIAQYISEDLVKNPEFINEMINMEPATVREITKTHTIENLITNNPSLANNPQFMAEAISQDVNAIKYADKEMLNNYDVFATSSKENNEVANYMLEHTEEFGDNAIKGAKDGTTERLRINTVDMLQGLMDKYGDEGNLGRQIRNQQSREKEDDGYKAKSLVQILKKSRWAILDENELNVILNAAELRKVELERDLKQNSGLVISQEKFGALITPYELMQLIQKSQIKDKEAVLERVEKYQEFYTKAKEFKSKEKETKEKREVVRETQEERDTRLRTPDQILIATKHFNTARKCLEKLQDKFNLNSEYTLGEKEKLYSPENLKDLLDKSELKEDKDAIVWLEEYTKFYKNQQEKINNKIQEYNAEQSVTMIAIIPSSKGIERTILHAETASVGIKLSEKQLEQLNVDLKARNVERDNIKDIETSKRGREVIEQDR